MHSVSSDAGSATHRAIPSTVDQQSGAYGNGQSPAALPASVLTHEQTNHANHPDLPTPLQTLSPARSNQSQSSKDETSSTQASPVTQLSEALQETANISPSAASVSSPNKENPTRDNSSDVPTTPVRTATTTTTAATAASATNGASKALFSNMSTSSSSSSSLSVSTPSSTEHATRKQVPPVSSTQVARRVSMSAPGAPITLILNKDQKGSFGLTVAQHDKEIWVQSVQPHGPADQQDIRAGDHLTQINGTPIEALKFADVQNMLEHANSNQIHLTCVPYREPQPQPVVVSLSQVDSLPMLAADDAETNKEDDPRTRSIAVGQETLIEIDRGQSGLGLSVVGGSDTQLSGIIIHDIYDGCAAQRDSRLLVGDQILEVNSVDLRFATHEEAIQALRQATTIVRILVLRGRLLTEMTNEQDKFDLLTVELSKKSGKGLGFSIIGRRHGFGVFISHILEGGSAEKDGRLMSGDLILEVNGQDLRTAAYEHVAYTLKTLPHGRVNIKIGRLKARTPLQSRQHATSHDRKNRSRSSSSNFRRTSASKANDR